MTCTLRYHSELCERNSQEINKTHEQDNCYLLPQRIWIITLRVVSWTNALHSAEVTDMRIYSHMASFYEKGEKTLLIMTLMEASDLYIISNIGTLPVHSGNEDSEYMQIVNLRLLRNSCAHSHELVDEAIYFDVLFLCKSQYLSDETGGGVIDFALKSQYKRLFWWETISNHSKLMEYRNRRHIMLTEDVL